MVISGHLFHLRLGGVSSNIATASFIVFVALGLSFPQVHLSVGGGGGGGGGGATGFQFK